MTAVDTPYEARGRFLGRYDFCCPYCGHLASYQLSIGQWRIVCKGMTCRKTLGIGTIVFDLSKCKGKMPIPPDVTMPLLPVVEYGKGEGLARVVEPDSV